MWGGEEKFLKHLKIQKFFAKDPILRNSPKVYDMTREEMFEEGYKKLNRWHEVYKIDTLSTFNVSYYGALMNGLVTLNILTNIGTCVYSSCNV